MISRPYKRARSNSDDPESPSPPSQVKCEGSSSPPIVERRLVTSGTRRFTPIPNDCLPPCTNYKQNRSEWVASRAKELEALSLIPGRRLFREDGLIIDWKSPVPVWSDTLEPDPQDLAATIMLAHRSNAQWHRPAVRKVSPHKPETTPEHPRTPPISGDVSEAGLSPKKRFPVPPRPSSKRRNVPSQLIYVNSSQSGPDPSSCSESPRFPDETEREAHSPSRDHTSSLSRHVPIPSDVSSQHGQFDGPSRPRSNVYDQSIALGASRGTEEEMSEMTLDYLRQYVQTYESDRASLASAYASNASFAYRVHYIVQDVGGRAPQYTSSGIKRTRLDIVTTLLALPCLHSNGQNPSIAQIEYDIFYLGADLGMFVVCRAVDSTKTVVHNFILQRKEVDVEDAVIEGVWPLTAAAHQILVFQT